MNDPGKNEPIANQAKELFDDSVERLDAATLSRLNQGRHKALAELSHSGPSVTWLRWAPAAGVAAAAVVAVVVMRGPQVDELEPVTASDFEMLLEEDGFEMFEDLEFYAVLDAVAAEVNGDVG
ncbi:MAG: hypothetical protein OER22_14250 [Gammaproteobacteria bacterium]|nr:hypothetical protein [Gammaproteobacteria bacterium]MDH3372324.1 hypothetical protein [Gammaproteobacteria bacterium]MDH3410520.1 hypothetical protein [Gammaproteobacteria bacterium]MDH3553771.1 hypothetical protein [Gammaproteobacteria bacterium]